MTRKDYELVAQSLAQAYNESKNTPVIGVTVADCFQVVNYSLGGAK